jgi:hypothetical protein
MAVAATRCPRASVEAGHLGTRKGGVLNLAANRGGVEVVAHAILTAERRGRAVGPTGSLAILTARVSVGAILTVCPHTPTP